MLFVWHKGGSGAEENMLRFSESVLGTFSQWPPLPGCFELSSVIPWTLYYSQTVNSRWLLPPGALRCPLDDRGDALHADLRFV